MAKTTKTAKKAKEQPHRLYVCREEAEMVLLRRKGQLHTAMAKGKSAKAKAELAILADRFADASAFLGKFGEK